MAIYVRCSHSDCKRLVPWERETCKCGRRLRTSGRNYYVVYRRGGCKHTISLGKVSLEYARKREAELRSRPVPEKQTTWVQLRYAYLRKIELEGKSSSYQNDTRRYLREMGAFWGDDKSISDIDTGLVQQFFLSLLSRDRKLSAPTLNRYRAAGRAAWIDATDLPNPFKRIKPYREDPRTAYLGDDLRGKLLLAAQIVSQDLYEILQVALLTGLRKSEILNLRRDMVDLRKGIAIVIQKGGRPRTILLSKGVVAVLQKIPGSQFPYFWCDPQGRPHKAWWRSSWERARQLAGLPPTFRFHDLRHDYATRAYEMTGDIGLVKELVGHTELSTTMRYAHMLPAHLREHVEKVGTLPVPSGDNS